MSDSVAAAIDIGGSTIRTALIASAGEVIAEQKWPVDRKLDPTQTLQQVNNRIWALAERCNVAPDRLIGFGISCAGELDAQRGYLYDAVNLGWRDVQLVQLLHDISARPVLLEMDAHAAVLGEAWLGAGHGVKNLVLIIVGTGIGAGLILDGHLYRGKGGLAGELGHMTVQQNGPLCGCGRYGCLEAISSGLAIAQAARAAILRGEPTHLTQVDHDLDAADVFQAARTGDACAVAVVERAAQSLGVGIASLIHLLSPEAIILSGGVALNGADLLLPLILRVVDSQLGYWARRISRRIVASPLGDHGGLIGVAHRVFEEFT